MLLGTAAAGAMLFGYGRTARAGPDACVVVGNTATCQGNHPDGIRSGIDFDAAVVTVLNVNSLTANITPGFLDGIRLHTFSDATIVSDTGSFVITATGLPSGHGVYARTLVGGAGTVRVDHTGGITAQWNGIHAESDPGGAVTVNSTADITTSGGRGIYAVSIGTGIGDVEVTSNGTIIAGSHGIHAVAFDNGSTTVHSSGDITSTVGSGFYIRGGVYSGSAEVMNFGNIHAGRAGIYALTFVDDVTITTTGTITAAHQGIYAYGRDGAVSVTNNGNVSAGFTGIWTRALAGAITVHSTGDVKSSSDMGIFASAIVGDVSITSVGNVEAPREGIYARAPTGSITVESTADVVSTLDDAIRILTNVDSTITLRGGRVFGADDGVEFEGSGAHTLHNFADLSGNLFAVRADTGDVTVNNHGMITGDIDLGVGANAVFNEAGGTFRSGAIANLGGGNTLTNRGILAPGLTPGQVLTTALTGNLVQTGSGTFAVDLGGASSDRVNVTGNASLAGTVLVNMTSLPATTTQQYTILSAAGGTTNNGLAVVFASPMLKATLAFPNPNDVVLGIAVDFSIDGLNRNQRAIATHLGGSFGASASGLNDVLLALFNSLGLEAYKDALDQLSPEIYNATTIAALYASLDFSNALLSCKTNGADAAAIVREGQCLWASAQARFLDSDQTRENIGFDETAGLFSTGAQVALDPSWRLGFGVSYQKSTLEMDTGAESDGDLVMGGLALKYNTGPLLLAATATGGRGWYDTTRPIAFGGFSATAEGRHEVDVLTGGLHASYVLGNTALYAKPLIDVNITHLNLGDVSETGAGGAGLVVQDGAETVVTVAPALEIGSQWHQTNGAVLRPFIRIGATWFSDDEIALDASFSGSPAGVAPFRIVNELDEVRVDFGIGFDLVNGQDTGLRLSYDGSVGETTESQSVALKGSARF